MKNPFLSWKDAENKTPLWLTSLIVSLAGHLILFSCLFFINGQDFKKKRQMKFIDVELMQLPVKPPEVKSETRNNGKKESAAPPKKRATVKKKTSKTTKRKAAIVKPAKKAPKKSTAKTAPPKKVTKKRTTRKKTKADVVKPKDILENARAKLQEDMRKQKENAFKERLKKMKEEVASQSRQPAAAGKASGKAVSTSGIRSADAFESYMNNIRVLIRENWAFNKSLAKKQENLVTDVQFTVLPSGQIDDEVWFEKRSGNSRYDQSVYNAVMKSNPLPPFPAGLDMNSLPVTMQFNLNELP